MLPASREESCLHWLHVGYAVLWSIPSLIIKITAIVTATNIYSVLTICCLVLFKKLWVSMCVCVYIYIHVFNDYIYFYDRIIYYHFFSFLKSWARDYIHFTTSREAQRHEIECNLHECRFFSLVHCCFLFFYNVWNLPCWVNEWKNEYSLSTATMPTIIQL